ncbi:MAG: adenylate/guanylate cyclase domain-containing protein [Ignavibacteria bacterium]|nr:adenylate/guanylate cyclase domain-containing protein [Ignavibacteria bacterium]MBT8381870.1 adenylate/guanylate cyclase domain-containing protein [Ignavibacteria bacterium]NNL21834.1 adenylate/guanylate cyclase domain-containing protein [Ignavibacteriaceae bacterium]
MKDSIGSKKSFIQDLFSEELYYNIKVREYIIGGVFAILVLFMVINLFIFADVGPNPEAARNTFIGLLVLLVIIVLRSFSVRKIIERKKKLVKKNIRRLRYINAILESTIPSVAIILLTFFLKPIVAVNSPAVFLYFIFIFISILDLEFKVCALAGFIAAIQYLFISLLFLDSYKEATELPIFVLPLSYIAKTVILLVSGFAAGGVAHHLKNKIVRSLETLQERNELEKIFGQQVSKEVVDEFINNKLEITSKKRNVSVMFLDIRNFSKFCEGKSPEEINKYQNEVLGFMIEEVNRNSGIVNQILGDGFMATFGAPVEYDNHTQNAVSAALQIVNELNKKNENGEILKTNIGIGIHTGEAFTGNVGTQDRQQYSITGNTVIMAARLEQLNKEFNSSVIVSKDVIEKIKDVNHSSLGNVNLKGFANPIELYRLT